MHCQIHYVGSSHYRTQQRLNLATIDSLNGLQWHCKQKYFLCIAAFFAKLNNDICWVLTAIVTVESDYATAQIARVAQTWLV